MFSKPDPKKQLQQQKRELTKVERELERDRAQLDRQEQVLMAEIKKAAKQGNQAAAKTYAKELVRLRAQRQKSHAVSSQIKGIGMRATTAQSNLVMSKAMTGATKVMATANKQMDPAKIRETMMDFERQNMQMDMAEEMMSDTLDGIMDGEEDEEESQHIMDSILDEIGIDMTSKLASVPTRSPAAAKEEALDEDLQQRLARLRA